MRTEILESTETMGNNICTLTRIPLNENESIWRMESTSTGVHSIISSNKIDRRVIEHWNGFINPNYNGRKVDLN